MLCPELLSAGLHHHDFCTDVINQAGFLPKGPTQHPYHLHICPEECANSAFNYLLVIDIYIIDSPHEKQQLNFFWPADKESYACNIRHG